MPFPQPAELEKNQNHSFSPWVRWITPRSRRPYQSHTSELEVHLKSPSKCLSAWFANAQLHHYQPWEVTGVNDIKEAGLEDTWTQYDRHQTLQSQWPPHPHAYVESCQDAQWTYIVMVCWKPKLSESKPEGLFLQRDSVSSEMRGLFGLERNPKVYNENSLGLGSLMSSCFQRAGGGWKTSITLGSFHLPEHSVLTT